MGITSYAQNFEDVMLWRALKNVENGFYVDVGACFPDNCSVTKAFYDIGWNGINIEPNLDVYEQLCEKRSLDINLNVAVGDFEGSIEYFEFKDELGTSTVCAEIAEEHRANGRPVKVVNVLSTTLTKVLEEYVKLKDISFLKIDVEGHERAVIYGMDWKRFRPWIVVVEAMEPWVQQSTHNEWEPYLLENDYIFAYADGLNRFYVSKEHEELLPEFKYPPNVFDDFKLATLQQAEDAALEAKLRTVLAEERALIANEKLLQVVEVMQRAEEKAKNAEVLKQELESMYASSSWRITMPLRNLNSLIRFLVKRSLTIAVSSVEKTPRIKSFLIKSLHQYPRAYNLVRLFTVNTHHRHELIQQRGIGAIHLNAGNHKPIDKSEESKTSEIALKQLSKHASHIYNTLKKTMTNKSDNF